MKGVQTLLAAAQLLEVARAGLGLPQLRARELLAGARDRFALLRMRQVIFAGVDQIFGFHHDEMPAGNEPSVAGAALGNNATTIGQTQQHAVPFEVFLSGVMHIQKHAGIAQQFVPPLRAEIAARLFRFRETERNEPQLTRVRGKEISVPGEKFLPSRRHGAEERKVVPARGVRPGVVPVLQQGMVAERELESAEAARAIGGDAERINVGHA